MAQTQVPPVTGDDRIDSALADLADLDELALSDQHARLRAVQEMLADALEAAATEPGRGELAG